MEHKPIVCLGAVVGAAYIAALVSLHPDWNLTSHPIPEIIGGLAGGGFGLGLIFALIAALWNVIFRGSMSGKGPSRPLPKRPMPERGGSAVEAASPVRWLLGLIVSCALIYGCGYVFYLGHMGGGVGPGLAIAAVLFGLVGCGWLWADYISPLLGFGRRDF